MTPRTLVSHFLLVIFLCFRNDHVHAFNGGIEAGHLLDYLVETSRSLGSIDSLEDFQETRKNRTMYMKKLDNVPDNRNMQITGIGNVPIPLPFNNLNTQENQPFSIIDSFLNSKVFNDFYNISNDVDGGFFGNALGTKGDSETIEELGRKLLSEGRKVKPKKMMMRLLLGLKVLTMGVIFPLVLGIALFASWKGITISMMALLLAGIVALKNILSGGKHDSPQHVLVASVPSHHQHWWRKNEAPEVLSWDSPHELAYSGHR